MVHEDPGTTVELISLIIVSVAPFKGQSLWIVIDSVWILVRHVIKGETGTGTVLLGASRGARSIRIRGWRCRAVRGVVPRRDEDRGHSKSSWIDSNREVVELSTGEGRGLRA